MFLSPRKGRKTMSQQDKVGRPEDMPQVINLMTLLSLSPLPLNIHKSIRGLLDLAVLFEAVQGKTDLFAEAKSHEGDLEPCPAMDVYVPQWNELVKTLFAEVKEVDDRAKELVERIAEEIENFSFVELRAVANCTKEGCKSRDGAREVLGGFDEEGKERLM